MSYFLVLLLAIICFSSAALISSHTSSNSQTLSGVMSLERYYYPAKDNNNTTVEKLAEARDRVRHHTRFLRDSTPTEKGVIQFPLYKYSFDFDPSLVGIYYTRIRLGSPPQEYNMLIDTGSSFSWVSCSSCTNCPRTSELGVKMNFYNIDHSSTSMISSCSSESCSSCNQKNQCAYSLKYEDQSSTDGILVSDELYLDTISTTSQISSSSRIYFGCSTSRTGNLGLIAVDGLLGFARLGNSIISQLSSHGIAPKAFSHCLKGEGSNGGILVLGEILHPRMVYTPLVPSKSLYNVYLQSVAVQERTLPIDPAVFANSGDRGTIFDSGTIFVYLVKEAYEAVISAITIAVSPSAKLITSGGDPCYVIPLRFSNITKIFPRISLSFAGGASMDLKPADYLTHMGFVEDGVKWCIFRIASNPSLTIIGDVALRNRAVVYDLARQRVGWADYNCSLPVNVSISSGIDRVAHPAAFDYIIELKEVCFHKKVSSDERSKLEHARMDAENSKQRAFEESVKRWRAEEDAMDAIRMAEVSYKLSKEKEGQRKENEEILAMQKERDRRIEDSARPVPKRTSEDPGEEACIRKPNN